MKRISFVLILSIMLSLPASAAKTLPEPEIASCSPADGISKCEVTCLRKLGEQCLVTHVIFEGTGLRAGTELWKARFLTCKRADIDLQLKSMHLDANEEDESEISGIFSARVESTGGTVKTPEGGVSLFASRTGVSSSVRFPFGEFLNSGNSHVEASMTLSQCGGGAGNSNCNISGKLVAVTNPNIRCDFHDTTSSGAFRPASLENSPSITNSQQPVGRVGE